MRPAIRGLLQLPDDRLFEEVATGIRLILENAESLEATAVRLTAIGEHRGAAIIRALATEESAKVNILIDLIRCPIDKHEDKSRTAKAFESHLAKTIYANSCNWRPVDFAEVAKIVDRMRRPYELDGPNDVDWIASNVRGRRESQMYVDYLQDITVENGEHHWESPLPESLYIKWDHAPRCLVIARALNRVEITTPDGLAVVAEVWRSFEPKPRTTWQELVERNEATLVRVAEVRQLRTVDQGDARLILHDWPFPLWPLNLRRSRTPTKAELRRQRDAQIKWRMERDAEREPPPVVNSEKIAALSIAYEDFLVEEERFIASLPENQDTSLRIIPRGVSTLKLESYRRLRRMVSDLNAEELMDLAALGWFGRQRQSAWGHLHQHARDIISKASIDYVCGLGRYWMQGWDRWKQPPDVPESFTKGRQVP